jgi:hypothetical protein
VFTGESYLTSTGPNMFSIVADADGKLYLCDEKNHRYSSYKQFYSINSEKSEILLNCTSTNDEIDGTEVYEYFINDEPVNKEEYINAPQNILGVSDDRSSDYDLYITNPMVVNELLIYLKANH